MTTINLRTAGDVLADCVEQDIAPFLWGPPGVGKSAIVRQVADRLELPLIDFRLSMRDPVDLRGIPSIDNKSHTTKWLVPDELPRVDRDGERGILFLDEMNTASPSMQALGFQIVHERKVGDHQLPPGWLPIGAGNRTSDRAAAQRMPTPLKNRFAHFEILPDLETWCTWAAGAGLSPMILAFLRFRPDFLHLMPGQEPQNAAIPAIPEDANAFPSPRVWEKVARVLDKPAERRLVLIASLVGDAIASEVEAFVRVFNDLPSFDKIVKSPDKAKMPGEDHPDQLYALSAMLARKSTRENFDAVMTYAKRFPVREFTICTAVDAVHRDKSLCETQGFSDWIVENKDVTI